MLKKNQLQHLRKLAHNSNPVVWIGQHGLSENVLNEIEAALDHHELVKIKVRVGEREQRNAACDEICKATQATMIKKIGNTLSIYRANPDNPVISLP